MIYDVLDKAVLILNEYIEDFYHQLAHYQTVNGEQAFEHLIH